MAKAAGRYGRARQLGRRDGRQQSATPGRRQHDGRARWLAAGRDGKAPAGQGATAKQGATMAAGRTMVGRDGWAGRDRGARRDGQQQGATVRRRHGDDQTLDRRLGRATAGSKVRRPAAGRTMAGRDGWARRDGQGAGHTAAAGLAEVDGGGVAGDTNGGGVAGQDSGA